MNHASGRTPRVEQRATGLMQPPGARPQPSLMGTARDPHDGGRHLMAFDASLEGPTAAGVAWLLALVTALVVAVLVVQAH